MFAPHRARIVGTRHMAAAGQYLAAQAAFQILEAGGNAVDAGVAGGIALGVVQSEYVGFAGVAPIMIYLAETDEVVTISGLGWWPKAASVDFFHKQHGGKIPRGILRTVVPAAPDSWITALRRYGTMSYGDVAGAALRFARDGFPVPSLMAEIIADNEDEYRAHPANAAIYLPNGRPPQAGEVLVQTDLARTIQYMIDEERAAAAGGREAGLQAARDAFYRGDIAQTIAQHQR
jgi:gamma-glutamyltranspeptidase/glutathione hydrolase